MTQTQDEDVRDLAAMFAMAALIVKGHEPLEVVHDAYTYADDFMRVRTREPAEGIVSIAPQRKYVRKPPR